MKTIVALAIGIGIGAGACGAAWAWQWRAAGRTFAGVVRMQGDGALLLGHQATVALRADEPTALRDFANYVVDSGLARARAGTASGAYDAVLESAAAAIPAERRALSAQAHPLYVAARQHVARE
jgi:hypothetical protein